MLELIFFLNENKNKNIKNINLLLISFNKKLVMVILQKYLILKTIFEDS